ncbi:MAG: DnaD domain protein [Eubacteriales bacterium]
MTQPTQTGCTLPPHEVQALLSSDNGDAALLYLHLVLNPNCYPAWPPARLHAAMGVLSTHQILPSAPAEASATPPPPVIPTVIPTAATEPAPEYTEKDIKLAMDSTNGRFQFLCNQVAAMLGNPLNSNDRKILLTLRDALGFADELIILLVSWCMEKSMLEHGNPPTLNYIKTEGYRWAKREISTLEQGEDLIEQFKKYHAQDMKYLTLFHLKPRPLTDKERKYIKDWENWGFREDALTHVYNLTVEQIGNFKWNYTNGILKNLHAQNLHTLPEILSENRTSKPRAVTGALRHNGPTACATIAGNDTTLPPPDHARQVAEDGARLQKLLKQAQGETANDL